MMHQIDLDFSDHEEAVRVFDEAFDNPETQYRIHAKDLGVAQRWIRDNAYKRSFGWGDPEKHPAMKKGQLIHLDEMYYRNRCGYAAADYTCDHPDMDDAEVDKETGKRMCFASSCPLASQACCGDLKELDPDLYKEYECKNQDEDDSCGEWMVLHSRPKDAFVENVILARLPEKAADR